MVRRTSTTNFERIAHLQDRVVLDPYTSSGDLLDEASLISILREYRPDEVYNLAAQSFVQTSFAQPVLTGEITALGVTRLLDAIRIVDPEIRFYQASSSEMFGKVQEVPQTETHARSTRARPTASPRSTATGSPSTTASPTTSTPAAASCSTTSRLGAGMEFVPRKVSHGVAQIKLGHGRRSCRSATSTPSATGASPATTSRRCG